MHPLVAQHLDAIRALCRDYGVARLEVFGSACTPEFDPERSDVDFLVEYPPDHDLGPWMARFFDLQESLSAVLDRDVDLVMTSAARNEWFRREAERMRTVVYDATGAHERNPGAIADPSPPRHGRRLHPKSPKWLHDITDASTHVLTWTADIELVADERDHRLRSAVERNVGIVGTALLALQRTDSATAACLSDYQTVIEARDRVLYRYDDIDHREVWVVVHDLLPVLQAEAEQMLAEAESER